jgi:two-component system phosphate regulon sensor histidine kinase PhoR
VSTGFPGSLLFATHLFGLLAATGAAISLLFERGRSQASRVCGAVGFGALGTAEVMHGAGFVVETDPLLGWVRVTGFAFLLVAALLPRSSEHALPAVFAIPGGAISPMVFAFLAGVASFWRRRGDRGAKRLAIGIFLLGASDAVLGLESWAWANQASHALRVIGYLMVSWLVVAFARHSIRFRFIVGFSALLVAVVLFVSIAIGTVIDRNLREGALNRVADQAFSGLSNLKDRVGDEVGGLVSITGSIELQNDVERGNSISGETMQRLKDDFLPDVDFALLLSRSKRLLGLIGLDRGLAGLEVAGSPVVTFAAREGGEAVSLQPVGSGLALLGVAPIFAAEESNRVVGVGVAGFRIDEDLLRGEVVAGGESRVLVLQGRRGGPPNLAASFGFETITPELPPPTTESLSEVYELFLEGRQEVGRTLRIDGEDHFSGIVALRDVRGILVGMIVVAEPTAVLGVTQREVNQVLFLITVGVIGLAFGLALVAAGRITRPLVTLTGAARRVSAGDLDAKAEVGGEDEVADLAVAFNRMTDSVTGMTEELRLAATEQSQLRARLETVVNSMGDGLIAVDDDGRVVTYNPAAGSIVGVPRSRVVGKPLREVLRGRDDRGRRLGARGSSPNGVAFVSRPDGTEAPVSITTSPLRDGQGTRLGRVYVIRDMSREHEVERMKREFLANVSHELRTPLTPIIGYSEIITKRSIPMAKTKEFAGDILDSARRLERIVAMLVDFSAIEAGRMAVDVEPTPLGPLVKEAVRKAGDRHEKHRFTARVASALPSALVSPSLFTRTLAELLDNAVKYSPKGGRVIVSVARSSGAGRRMLDVAVTDQGIGIEPDNLARIFQDFSQVDASDTRAFGGLGLGLTFVKRIAEAHGGTISAESTAGKGSTFSFTVPAADTKKRKPKR